MRRIIPLELVGHSKLDYDLYDENGELIYKEGTELTPDFLMMLNYKKVYKRETQGRDLLKPEEQEFQSVISDTAKEDLVKSTKEILRVTYDGGTPDISACTEARNTIVEEVGEKLEKIDCIGQLRVFDEYTFSHTINVSTLSAALGMTLGLSENDVKDLTLGGLLHDIGKMKIPKRILNKPGKLDAEEFDLMKKHTILGYEIIRNKMNLPENIARVALEHQEKYGGTGYPSGLKGQEITLFAQIASIADVYDALVSKRVYKDPIRSHNALQIMLSDGSNSFNPFMLYKFVYLANWKDTTNLVIRDEDKI